MYEGALATQERIDAVHSVLADSERRSIVRMLAAGSSPIAVPSLVDRLADEGERTAVHTRLYHQHLPKMAEVGFVEYDPDAERVALTSRGKRADTVATRTAELLAEERRK
jgi:hypothetical protein